jgi:hypothetical protein
MTIEEFTIVTIDPRVTDVEVTDYIFKIVNPNAQEIWNILEKYREKICKAIELMAMEKQLKMWEEYYEEVKSGTIDQR